MGHVKDAKNESILKNASDCKNLGYRVTCYACHAAFYDLGVQDPSCPNCKTLYSKSVKMKHKKAPEAVAHVDVQAADEVEELIDTTEE